MLHTQELVHNVSITKIIHTVCVSEQFSPLLLTLVLIVTARLPRRLVFGKLFSLTSGENLPHITFVSRFQPVFPRTHNTSFLPAFLGTTYACSSAMDDSSGSVGYHGSLPLIRQPQRVALLGLPEKALPVFVVAAVLSLAMPDKACPVPKPSTAELANTRGGQHRTAQQGHCRKVGFLRCDDCVHWDVLLFSKNSVVTVEGRLIEFVLYLK